MSSPPYDQADGVFVPSFAGTVTAAGSTQGTATAITTQATVVTTAAAGTGVIFSASTTVGVMLLGAELVVYNNGANALLVYPPSGAKFDNLAANTAVSLATNTGRRFLVISATQLGTV